MARSSPYGLNIQFEAESDLPVTKIEFDLEGDTALPMGILIPVRVGYDGRNVRRYGYKPAAVGHYPLTIRAWNSAGAVVSVTCTDGVTFMDF